MTRVDHFEMANSLLGAEWRNGQVAVAQLVEAQVHATLALVEQQKIANKIALANLVFPDGRTHLANLVTDPLPHNAIRVKPDIAAALGVES